MSTVIPIKPSDACKYFHHWDCARREVCPVPCNRFDFYTSFDSDDELEPQEVS